MLNWFIKINKLLYFIFECIKQLINKLLRVFFLILKKSYSFIIPENDVVIIRRLFILGLLIILLNNRIDFLNHEAIVGIQHFSDMSTVVQAIATKNDLIYILLYNNLAVPQSLFEQLNLYLNHSGFEAAQIAIDEGNNFTKEKIVSLIEADNTRNNLEFFENIMQFLILLYSFVLAKRSSQPVK